MSIQPTKEQATHAFLWDMAGLLAKQGILFLVSIVLSRLVGPSEFGLVTMSMVFISVSEIFADIGFASGIVQSRETTSLTYSSVFYLNVTMGMVLFVLFWVGAPLVADFYSDERITPLVRLLSVNFIFSGFNQVQQAILRRQLKFERITALSTIAHLTGGVLSIILAFRGWGVNALVAQNLVTGFVNTIVLWRVAEWKPRFEFAFTEVRKLFSFSMYVFLSQVTNRLVQQFDVLVVGKLFSASIVGFYTRASSLNSLVSTLSSTSVSRVAFPFLSRFQEDRIQFENYYFAILEFIAFGAFGISGSLLLAGQDLIIFLFGENWAPSVFIFQVLVLKSFTYPVSLLIVSTFMAGGKSRENFWYGNIRKVVTLAPALVAIGWGFDAFLYAVVGAAYVNWLLNNWFVTISFKVSLYRQVRVIAPYFGLFVILSLVFQFGLGFVQSPGMGVVKAIVFAALYFVLNLLFRTDGYTYLINNLKPLWKRLKERSGPE